MNLNYILLQGSRWIRRIIRKKNKVEEIKTKKEIRDLIWNIKLLCPLSQIKF